MKILTIGDSWTYGDNSTDPATKSWPAQLANNYGVEVVNLARSGSSNHRAARIGIEELCRDPDYDLVIFPLAPANRTEVLSKGKWHQVWPNCNRSDPIDKLYTELWHPWGDIQQTILLSFWFIHSLKALNIPLYMTGLSLHPALYKSEISWITNYNNDNDFNSLGMPLSEFDIGTNDLDRKLKSLKGIHTANLKEQPDYLYDVVHNYLLDSSTQIQYNYKYSRGHPNDAGYYALSEYFANKIGLTTC
jgi:hypothetical protein